MGIVLFNGISSMDYGIVVEHPPGYQTPARDYEAVHIPGRNGDLMIDGGSYQNAVRSYELAVGNLGRNFADMANAVSEWLNAPSGYARLEDSYEPEYYRMAVYQNEMDIENILFHAGRVTVEFNCKPQRFLKTGETALELSAATTLRNPTGFTALPLLTVYGSGSGTLSVGAYSVRISNIGGSLYIDSDIQDAYAGSVNRNADVTMSDGFPRLSPGETVVSWTGGVTRVGVVPRWWTL